MRVCEECGAELVTEEELEEELCTQCIDDLDDGIIEESYYMRH